MKKINTVKPFVFVMMPFDKSFEDVYKLGIKSACEELQLYCERVDEQVFAESILDRIYNQIAKADVIVADMTGRNPNVFYEAGYAHAMGKRVILLTQAAEDIPFDLKHYPHIIYEGSILDLKDKLKPRLEWAVNLPEKELSNYGADLEYYIHGVKIEDGVEVFIEERYCEEAKGLIRTFQLDFFNVSDRTVFSTQYQFSLITQHFTGEPAVKLPDNRYMHLLPEFDRIYPQAWGTVSTKFYLPEGVDHHSLNEPGVSAVFQEVTEFSKREIPIILKLRTQETLERMKFRTS